MTDTSDVMRDVEHLCSGWGDTVPSSLIFGQLAKRAAPVITHYHSYLFWDAMWVHTNVRDSRSFYWGVDEYGTSIGDDPSHARSCRRSVYRVSVLHDERDRWTMSFEVVS